MEAKVRAKLGCQCKIGCSNCAVRAPPYCWCIMQARMVGNVARLGVKMLWIRSSACADPKIIRLSRVYDLRFILKNCGIGLRAMLQHRSKRNSKLLRRVKSTLLGGGTAIYVHLF